MPNQIEKQAVTLIRIYTDDSHGRISTMLDLLSQRDDVLGATIFRGVASFGAQGVHKSSLLDLSGHLPVVIEFYHNKKNCQQLLEFIHEQISHAHIISWEVNLSFEHID